MTSSLISKSADTSSIYKSYNIRKKAKDFTYLEFIQLRLTTQNISISINGSIRVIYTETAEQGAKPHSNTSRFLLMSWATSSSHESYSRAGPYRRAQTVCTGRSAIGYSLMRGRSTLKVDCLQWSCSWEILSVVAMQQWFNIPPNLLLIARWEQIAKKRRLGCMATQYFPKDYI